MSQPKFWKYQAVGNSYIVLEGETPDVSEIKRLCSPQVGIGSDGILMGRQISHNRFSLRIFNPDGTEAEKSGNGIRIFVRSLWDRAITDSNTVLLQTKGGAVKAWRGDQPGVIDVEMGAITVFPNQSDPTPENFDSIEIDGEIMEFTPVSAGNPHCVIFHSDNSSIKCQRLGPLIEAHPRFPSRTNVQFTRIINRRELSLEIWERGAGYTLSSGTSACAAAAAALFHGWIDPICTVHCAGGPLFINLSDPNRPILSGSVQKIAWGTFNRA